MGWLPIQDGTVGILLPFVWWQKLEVQCSGVPSLGGRGHLRQALPGGAGTELKVSPASPALEYRCKYARCLHVCERKASKVSREGIGSKVWSFGVLCFMALHVGAGLWVELCPWLCMCTLPPKGPLWVTTPVLQSLSARDPQVRSSWLTGCCADLCAWVHGTT